MKNRGLEKVIETLRTLNEQIEKKYKAEIIGVFGSYVRSEQKRKVILMFL